MGRNLGPLNIKDTYEGLVQISGSQLTDGSGSLIPSLDITASFASQAGTSGFAAQAGTAGFASTSTSASFADQSGTSGYATTALSASFAVSSSADSLTLQQVTDNGATTTNGITAGGFTVGNRVYGQDTITSAVGGGTYSIRGGTNLAQLQLTGNNNPSTNSITLKGVGTNDYVTIVGNTKIDDDLYVIGDITGSNIQTDNLTATSASIGHLTTVTGSAVIIGDAYVVVNSSATTRYAGIKVYESGAAVPTTASLEFDSQTNDWFYEYTGSDPTNFGAVMFGPEYSTKGSPIYPTANTLVKGNGGHHIIDSSITDDGTDVVVSANISASGFISASTYYGDGSNLTGVATGGGFPYTGSAEISGSLSIQDPLSLGNALYIKGGILRMDTDSYNSFAGINIGQSNTLSPALGNTAYVFGINNNNSSANGGFVHGENNTVNSPSYGSVVIGAYGATLGASFSGIFAGTGGNVSYDNSVILGGNGLSTSKSEEAVVQHLSIYGDTFISSSTLGTGSLIDNLGQEGVATTTAIEHMVYCTQAEYNALTPDANTMYVISGSADIVSDLVVSGSLVGEVTAISVASSTGSLDCSVGNYFTLGLANAADTRLEASNIQAGQTINIKITNNATAAGTISFGPEFEFEGGTAFTATAATSAVDIITLVSFDGTSLQTVGVKNFS